MKSRLRSLFGAVGRVLSFPFRLIARPFRWLGARLARVRRFFTDVPPDESLTETLGDALESRDSLRETFTGMAEHIDALRFHLLRSVIVLAITTALSVTFAAQFMEYLARPLPEGIQNLQMIEPTEGIGVYMRVSLLAGVALAMPWIIGELYLFIAPGLMPRSRLLLLAMIPAATVLFLLGLAFTYFVMLPAAVPFLFNFGNFRSAWRPAAYFGLVTTIMFWIGIFFQLPLVVYILAAVGVLRASQLARQWRMAVIVIAVIAAAVTPTVDPVNMALVMVPMVFLYLLSIVGAAIAGAGRERDLRRRAQGAP